MLPDRANNAENWEFDTLVVILLRQFKRLFAQRDLELTEADFKRIGADAAQHRYDAPEIDDLRAALADIIAESEGVLDEMGLDFPRALATGMDEMPGWETTADFLELANEKINAEVRIGAGSALLAALGDSRFAAYLLHAIDHDLSAHGQLDVDAVLARRALIHAAHIDQDAADWLEKARAWAESKQ